MIMEDFVEGAKYGREIYEENDSDIPRKKQRLSQREEREQQRKFFHGAFKGGFTVGHFGTVGSKEGWQPKNFKSSRKDGTAKSSAFAQSVQDFMDSEDEEMFDSGSGKLRAKASFGVPSQKEAKRVPHTERQLLAFSVESLLRPSSENIGDRLLRSMGWKPGQGIGRKMSLNKKNPDLSAALGQEATVSPDDIQAIITKFKEDTFGLGYKGVEKPSFSSYAPSVKNHVFGVMEKGKKIRISGQAFGVGIDDDEDDLDLYSREDLSQYDFELGPRKKAAQKQIEQSMKIADRFVKSPQSAFVQKFYKPPELPKDFRIENLKISTEVKAPEVDESEKLVGRKERNTLMQKGISTSTEWEQQNLSEPSSVRDDREQVMKEIFSSRFVSRGTDQEHAKPAEEIQQPTAMRKPRRGGRSTVEWFPDKLLCTRFNVPCPYLSAPAKKKEPKSTVPLFTALQIAKEKKEQQRGQVAEDSEVIEIEDSNPPKPPPAANLEVATPVLDRPAFETQEERPSMDLFKAIFADSESDSEESSTKSQSHQVDVLESKSLDVQQDLQTIPVPSSERETGESKVVALVESVVVKAEKGETRDAEEVDKLKDFSLQKPLFVRSSEREKGKSDGNLAAGKAPMSAEELRRSRILERLREFDDEHDDEDDSKSSDSDEWVEAKTENKKDKKKKKKHKKEKKKKKRH